MCTSCDRDRIRTYDRLLRRQMLYPAELRDQNVGVAGFEPATSCSQSRRDDRATLHPEYRSYKKEQQICGETGIRTLATLTR